MRKPARLLLAALLGAGILAITVGVGAAGAGGGTVVKTRGGFKLGSVDPADPPNLMPVLDLRFERGTITVRHGSTVTWVDADRERDEPHTITVATKRDLPRTNAETTPSRCRPCRIASGHLIDPQNPDKGIKTTRLEAGKAGFDREGDSLFLGQGKRISAEISAPAGSTLYYMCVIHPWMQGRINVTS